MLIIDTNTVVIFSATELRTVLETNNGYTYIYFGSNITLATGITISSFKNTVVIDGTYQGVRYTYEDMTSSGNGDTISVRNSNIQQVIVKNMNVLGHNYYGLIYVPESVALQNIVVEYNNIIYSGPQITYHPTGLSRYIDCDIKILTSYSAANEVAECNRIEIGGITKINHTSTGNSMFWYRGNALPYLKILGGANVTVISEYRELFYGVNNLAFIVSKNASFILKSHNGMGYNGYSTGEVLLEQDCNVSITQTAVNGGYPTWYCNGSFVMNEGSSLIMYANYAGIIKTNYNIYFRTVLASVTLNNPKYVLLYNSGADVIYTELTISFSLSYSRINMWTQAANISIAGSLNDLPTYYWYKEQDSSSVSGQILLNNTIILSNNYTADELKTLFSLDNFKFQGKKVLSIGNVLLNLPIVIDTDLVVLGITDVKAEVRLTYNQTSQQVIANPDGSFRFVLEGKQAVGSKLNFIANLANSFLYRNGTATVVFGGMLLLNPLSETITFSMTPYSKKPVLCARTSSLSLSVTDSRVRSTNWKLYASILNPLTSSQGDVLTDSLVYIDSNHKIFPLNQQPLLIYQGTANSGSVKDTSITFLDNEGIILRVMNEPVKFGVIYSSKIIWTLEE